MILLFLMILFLFLLTRSELAFQYASEGLLLWFQHMIPALFPCIVWSSLMIETDNASRVTRWFHPVIHRLLGLSAYGSFVFLVGFTGGFPLGAKLSSDLYQKGRITLSEAEFLLSFSNNLGPVYLFAFLFPALGISRKGLCLFILYGIPVLYGYIRYRLVCHGQPFAVPGHAMHTSVQQTENFSAALDLSLHNGVNSIVMLGAYVIFFQSLRLFYIFLPEKIRNIAVLFTEINSGINHLKAFGITESGRLLILCGITFGGLCCIAQTSHVLQNTKLSTGKYILHKLIQTALVFLSFYVCLNVLHISL